MSAEVQCVKQSIRFFRLLFQLPRILVPSSPGCEAKGDTALFWLLTLEAGLLKRLKFQPGDRAEKTSFNLVRKKLTFYRWKVVTFALVPCKGKPPTSREPYMINNHWMRWCLRPSSAYGHGNTYVNEKRVCLFIQQRIRTERSGF